MRQVRTFDVFDTVVTRRVGDPSSAFLLLGDRALSAGLATCSAEVFARARQRAEPLAAAQSPVGLAGLNDIWAHVVRLLELPERDLGPLVELELALERALIVPVPGARERLDAVRRSGAEIVFVSDMYLPSDFIGSLLLDLGLRRPAEAVYVSAELGRSKRRGDLFDHLLAVEQVSPAQVAHVGDDRRGDVERPLERGISAAHFTSTALTRYERTLEAHRWESHGLASTMAGASRLSRLDVPAESEHEIAIRDVTAGVAAPLLVGYVVWLLRRARELGLDRLYFVSRDGEVLLRIAERIAPSLGVDVQLLYIYGSRQAWYPAAADPDRPEDAVRGLGHPYDDSLHVLLDRCGVEPGDWLPFDVTDRDPDRDRTRFEELVRTPAFLDDVRRGLLARQERLVRYVDGAGLFDGGRHGVVDLGWHGRSLSALTQLLERHDVAAPTGFYLGLTRRDDLRQPVEVWLAGMEQRLRIVMMETFCTGTHGQVTDYSVAANGTVTPVMRELRNAAADDWGLPLLRRTVDSFTGHLADAMECCATPQAWRGDVRHASMAAFRSFYDTPTRAEAQAWGRFPFEISPVAAIPELLAPERGLLTRVRARVGGKGAATRWPAGDLALAPQSWRLAHSAWASSRSAARRVVDRARA